MTLDNNSNYSDQVIYSAPVQGYYYLYNGYVKCVSYKNKLEKLREFKREDKCSRVSCTADYPCNTLVPGLKCNFEVINEPLYKIYNLGETQE